MELEGLTSQLTGAPAVNMHNEETITKDGESSASIPVSTSNSLKSNNNNSSVSNFSSHDDGNDMDDYMCGDDDEVSNGEESEDNDGYMFDEDDVNDDYDYLSMQAQFDNADFPAGVEASVPWLNEPTPPTSTATASTSHFVGGGTDENIVSLPVGIRTECSSSTASSSSAGQSSIRKCIEETSDSNDEALRKYQNFKRFDIVGDCSDHHYNNMGLQGLQPSKTWSKKIQGEWKILENDLPDTIYVRVYETRMDLLRAVIVGPQGTPYHDGLFVFDAFFPPTYPDTPPMVYYYSGGLRLNPNLYDCGKVCLSLLNTWTGKGDEKWLPMKSTMLQVLVSIQALILNAKPFFNEPGYETSYVGADGEKRSNAYNEDVFILSLKTMMYTLRRPPRHFEDLVAGHFQIYAHDILSACKAYMEGVMVGSVIKGKIKGDNVNAPGRDGDFKRAIFRMMNGLVSNFTKHGAKDCEKFRITS
ncbi:unnamed protein product [Cuscuta epithymum]|uniref:E2 ubiquitin-conjugating enzyme n=1 Tax=Cuscuta epithymum TaxID=186058 RepID=A0AAV0CHL2_9ASTE|nr:unnamed protein product [Cuscuta epithymum]CAH9139544.1 unnamed protein product [Cuscuta epithymum]